MHTLKQALLTAEMHAKKLGAGAARDISDLHHDIDQQVDNATLRKELDDINAYIKDTERELFINQ